MKSKIIVSLVMVFIILMAIPIFAGSAYPEVPYDAYNYWLIYEGIYGNTILLSSKMPIRAYRDGETLETISAYKKYRLNNNSWVCYSIDNTNDGMNHQIKEIIGSNHDIMYRNSSEVFFSARKATVLYPVMKRVDSGTILKNIFRGLIPLVGLIVLVACFRRGWGFLQSQLKR